MEYRIVRVENLPAETIAAMLALMGRNYRNVEPAAFQRDLAEKDWAILLEDPISGALQGFSTQQLYTVDTVRVVFSGDTIIDPAHWGSQKLPIAFGRMMLGILDREPEVPLYWFLISKGYRTYRYLPVFFREFYPSPKWPTPAAEQALLDRLAQEKFGSAFDAQRGVLRAGEGAQHLSAELADVEPRKRKDPHIAFFLERNPEYAQGEELVCLTPFERENLKPFILRQLEAESLVCP